MVVLQTLPSQDTWEGPVYRYLLKLFPELRSFTAEELELQFQPHCHLDEEGEEKVIHKLFSVAPEFFHHYFFSDLGGLLRNV